MMREEIRHADNEKIDLKVWKRLASYGLRYKARAELAGGIILILIGLKILLEHLGILAF